MIIDFTLKNFRSFRDGHTLSMNVEKKGTTHFNNFSEVAHGRLSVLRTAGIYGANAAGKSNVLIALNALRWIIVESGDLKEGDKIPPYEPYRLNERNKFEPVEFEIEFVDLSGARYSYFVSFTNSRIVEERLFTFGSRLRSKIFERGSHDTWETIEFGGNYKGGIKKLSFFPNQSYLSKAGNNAAAPDAIREIYRYFRSFSFVGHNSAPRIPSYFNDHRRHSRINKLLPLFDTGVEKVSLEENNNPPFIPEYFPEEVKKKIIEFSSQKFVFWHKSDDGDLVQFEVDDESDGTQQVFNILPLIVESLRRGGVLIIDEIENSFHPHLVQTILRLYNDRLVNRRNAQLIFTTHDTSSLSENIFRRDQLWFVEKRNGASSLYSLDEFDKRKVTPDSPFSLWYMDGRFGAVPQIKYADIAAAINEDISDEKSDQSDAEK